MFSVQKVSDKLKKLLFKINIVKCIDAEIKLNEIHDDRYLCNLRSCRTPDQNHESEVATPYRRRRISLQREYVANPRSQRNA